MVKHPRAIPYLFLTEMWERFSYYGITAILILYMSHAFSLTTEKVYAIYGAYGALVYMTPIIGGWLADKYLGAVNAVLIGGGLITIGHFIVAIPDSQFIAFYLGLAVIIVGTGLFSPNINAIVGHLYQENDERRERGFTLAYMGRNIGTVIAPIIASLVAAYYDWHYAFIVAGLGMLFGLYIFYRGFSHYNDKSFISHLNLRVWGFISVVVIVLIGLSFFLMERQKVVGPVLLALLIVMLLRLFRVAQTATTKVRNNLVYALVLTIFYILFMVLLQQSGGALNLFADKFVNKSLFGFTLQTGMFQAVEPLALVLLAPLYSHVWGVLSEKGIHLQDSIKFVLGLCVMSSSFVLMGFAMNFANTQGQIAMSWLNGCYLLQAAGELFIGPIGLAMVSRLIPNSMIGLYMGFWVLGSAIANFVAAKIGAYITPDLSHLSTKLIDVALLQYQHAFYRLSVFGFVAAGLLFAIRPLVNLYRQR